MFSVQYIHKIKNKYFYIYIDFIGDLFIIIE